MIGIYYIATDKYTDLFEGFLKTLPKFMKDTKKIVSLIADENLKMYEGYENDNIKIEYHHINHYPWPIISLYKFYLIQKYKIKNADKHFYFNANVEFTDNCIDFDYSIFDSNIVLPKHPIYKNNDYCQAGSICINNSVFDDFCNEYNKRINTFVNEKYEIPKWHDETIVNQMCLIDKLFGAKIFDGKLLFHGLNKEECLCYLRTKPFKKENKPKKVIGIKFKGRFANQLFTLGHVIFKYGVNNVKYLFINITSELLQFATYLSDLDYTTIDCECDCIEEGYFQSKYEQDITLLRRMFNFPKIYGNVVKKYIPDIENCVICHVRRGDYLQPYYSNIYNTINNDYIQKVYNKHFPGKKLLVVTDDVEWCQKNIANALVINSENVLFDFTCLCMCSGIIASPSTFSIMACYLNPCKSVVPYPLFKTRVRDYGMIEDNLVPNYCIRENLNIESN